MMNLHAALKLEFEKAQRTYTNGVTKLEALSLVNKDNKGDKHGVGKGATVSGKVAPIAQSHQRQLSLKACEIQGRDSIHKKSILKTLINKNMPKCHKKIKTTEEIRTGLHNFSRTWVGLTLTFGCSAVCLILLDLMRNRQSSWAI